MLQLLRTRRPGPVFVCSLDEAGDFSRHLKAGLLVSISDPELEDYQPASLSRAAGWRRYRMTTWNLVAVDLLL